MKQLHAPWRNEYSQSTAHAKSNNASPEGCVFCQQFAQKKDQDFFIIRRFTYNAILLNKYPYNAGHLLIIPFVHVSELFQVPHEARTEMIELMAQSQRILKEVLEAHGCNIGINIGKAAGAGIPSHIHAHVLPRWFGDTNFLPLFGETKQISFDLTDIYNQLKPAFDAL